MSDLRVDNLLNLLNSVLFEYDYVNDLVLYFYYRGKKVAENITFKELVAVTSEVALFDPESLEYNNVVEWIKNKKNDTYVSILNGTEGEKVKFQIKKLNLANSVICYAENLEEIKNNYDLKDYLTNTYQKEAYKNFVLKEIQSENPRKFYLLTIDVDNFKTINDTYGHMFGDVILEKIGNVLNKFFKNGYVGRVGGDEFSVICFDSCEYTDIWNKLHILCAEINEIGRNTVNKVTTSLTIGCAVYPKDAITYDDLFVKADRALYRGKKKGKGCFIIYNDEKHKDIRVDVLKRYQERLNADGLNPTSYIATLFDILRNNNSYEVNILELLSNVSKYFCVDRIVITSIDNEYEVIENVYSTEEIKQFDPEIGLKSNYSMWDNHLLDGLVKMNRVPNIEQKNPELFKYLNSQAVESVVRFPLTYGDNKLGFLRIDSKSLRTWSIEDVDLFKIVSSLISVYYYKTNETNILKAEINNDKLTGLYNYAGFVLNASNKLIEAKNNLCIYYVNLDKFKFINDTYSFKAGDKTLREISKALVEIYNSESSVIARFSGDKFLILDEYNSISEIDEKFTRLIKAKDKIFFNNNLLAHHIHLVTGVYLIKKDELEITSLIDKANVARKSIIDVNRTSYLIYNQEIEEKRKLESELEANFYISLNKEEFEVFLQPKINAVTNEMVGCEALSRWNYKSERYISPQIFIPLLEKSTLITRLDYYVFEKVCKLLRELIDSKKEIKPISVNLSENQMGLLKYVDDIEEIRKKYDIDPKYIEIEITESLFVSNIYIIQELIDKLHFLGYKISMDDFGSGYSNLALLSRFNFDVLKIDRSLCKEALNEKMQVILKAVIEMSKKLDLDLVCEGIETLEQADSLVNMGCSVVQGFIYDKPMKISEFILKYLKD